VLVSPGLQPKIQRLSVQREHRRISDPVATATVTPVTEAPPSRRTVFGRGLAILLAWHVVLVGVPALLAYWGIFNDDDCVAYDCLLNERGLEVGLTVAAVGIPALVSLLVSVAAFSVFVVRAEWPPTLAAVVGAIIGLVAACCGVLLVLGLDNT
jgi:hypothetical protein